ncbi:MAG: flavin reductase, partial [Nitrospirota bacterium]|nr:flavin reductase [Nitrospirota bacterium]
DTDKFQKARIKYGKATKVKPPLIYSCIGYIECKLLKTIVAGECYAFFGKVLAAYADDKYFNKGLWIEEAEIPLHLGGARVVYFKS